MKEKRKINEARVSRGRTPRRAEKRRRREFGNCRKKVREGRRGRRGRARTGWSA